MSQCRKFAPNIFHKSKCSNCFRQKEEHTAEALECNRASRSIARSGYLFVAPDWDFSVPLNRTKRWQRRWFVLYDDGELNYSVDEHPDTIPQGSVDMSKVLEVTGAEQVTGHPHSLALTSPDRVTFVKAASREDARWWAELLAVFPRRHKRNATFPGGRASPSLPQLGRSASPQPPRPRHLSVSGPSPRANFETPPLKEERELPPNETKKDGWDPGVVVEHTAPLIRKDYVISSGSPPTRDKLRCDDKARVRRDWRNERLRDIATALTDRSPESSLALPSEGLLHLKKGWLWLKQGENEWVRRWTVLCGPTLNVYRDQDEHGTPEITVELSTVTSYAETPADTKYGFRIEWAGPALRLSAVTQGIRSNWMQALKMAAPMAVGHHVTPKSMVFSSDDEYRTASEGGRRESGDWSELPPSPPLNRLALRARPRSRLPRCQSRQSTLDSTSTDELDGAIDPVAELQKQLARSAQEIAQLERQIAGLKQREAEAASREQTYQELLAGLEERNAALAQDQTVLQRSLAESRTYETKYRALRQEWHKQKLTHDVDVDRLDVNELKDYCLELRCRLDKAVKEVRTLKLTLKRSEEDYDRLELTNHSLKASLDLTKREHQSEVDLLVSRSDYLTAKLNRAEKARRRSLNLEDKVGELEAKMSSLEDRRTTKRRLRRFRRKSLDGGETGRQLDREELARWKVEECLGLLGNPTELEESLRELQAIVGGGDEEVEVVRRSVGSVVDQLQQVLLSKLNSLEGDGKLEKVAEKMAFERIIIGRIQQALEGPSSRLAEKEARETGHLIVALRRKLQGQTPATVATPKTSAAYLTKILTKYFISLGQGYRALRSVTLQPQSPSLQSLLEQQRKIHEMYRAYYESKLTRLTGHLDGLNELTSQIARRELIANQLGQALRKAARTYQAHFDADQSNCFAFYASERAALELWSDSVAVRLRHEIDNVVASLAERVPSEAATPPGELREFADVVAHKALIDARIDVLTGRFEAELTRNEDGPARCWFDRQHYLEELRDEPGLVGADLEAEFLCMLDQSLADLGGFDEVMAQTKEVQTRLDEFRRDGADLAPIDNWNDVCQKCQTLHDSLEKMRRLIGNGGPIRRSDSQKDQRTHLGTEYLTQAEQLRAAYRYALASCKERHQMADLEQLQLLCDKVLNSMDQWHRRTIQQMRETHAHELETLRQEKEQALAEETQATLAALDAMRKAHVAEVQREVARFKREYARQQRDEIVDLSERLSVKSLEAAALEEQLGSATRQLAQAQQRILHLERNPQLSSMQN